MVDVVESGDFEGLRNYVLGGKRRPTEIPKPNSRPRLPNQPTEETPGSRQPIPTSSQRPGKRTNDTIPYARMLFASSGIDATDIKAGDVVFVSKSSGSVGATGVGSTVNHNRASKVLGMRQLNQLLMTKSVGETTFGPGMGAAIAKARDERLQEATAKKEYEDDHLDYTNKKRLATAGPPDRFTKRAESLKSKIADLNAAAVAATAIFNPKVDWAALKVLRAWVPDGVLLSRDDYEHNADELGADNRPNGVCLNIAVAGPAPLRNTKDDKDGQLFDSRASVRDTMLLLLIAYQNSDKTFYFQYRPVSHQNLTTMANAFAREAQIDVNTGRLKMSNLDKTIGVDGGMTVREFASVCAAWKLGSCMDNTLVVSPERKMLLNVAISPLSIDDFYTSFHMEDILAEAGVNVDVSDLFNFIGDDVPV